MHTHTLDVSRKMLTPNIPSLNSKQLLCNDIPLISSPLRLVLNWISYFSKT